MGVKTGDYLTPGALRVLVKQTPGFMIHHMILPTLDKVKVKRNNLQFARLFWSLLQTYKSVPNTCNARMSQPYIFLGVIFKDRP